VRDNMRNRHIYFMGRNHQGAWVIYGVLGVRQYYYYTEKRAWELYMNEVKKRLSVTTPISQ